MVNRVTLSPDVLNKLAKKPALAHALPALAVQIAKQPKRTQACCTAAADIAKYNAFWQELKRSLLEYSEKDKKILRALLKADEVLVYTRTESNVLQKNVL